jgi:hypothetical protein
VAPRRKTKLATTLTLGDVELDLRKTYRFIEEGKLGQAKRALTRATKRLNAIRGPTIEMDAAPRSA